MGDYQGRGEIHELRTVLEPLAVQKAVEHSDQTYIDALEAIIDKVEAESFNFMKGFFF